MQQHHGTNSDWRCGGGVDRVLNEWTAHASSKAPNGSLGKLPGMGSSWKPFWRICGGKNGFKMNPLGEGQVRGCSFQHQVSASSQRVCEWTDLIPAFQGQPHIESLLASEGLDSRKELPSNLKGGTGSGECLPHNPTEQAVQPDLNQSSNIKACCLTHDATTSKSKQASTNQTIFKNSILGIKGTLYPHRLVPTSICWVDSWVSGRVSNHLSKNPIEITSPNHQHW